MSWWANYLILMENTMTKTAAHFQAPARYRFFIALLDGTEVVWQGLSQRQARDMYARTSKRQPPNVSRFGWEEDL